MSGGHGGAGAGAGQVSQTDPRTQPAARTADGLMSAPSVRCGISVVGDADAAIVCMEKLWRSRLQTELDVHLAVIKKSYGRRVVDIERELRGTGVQRTGICDGRKSAEFPTGGVRWRR